ncbi:MAG: hypothetical protein RL059_1287, partial [Bacteroidota bacterium]
MFCFTDIQTYHGQLKTGATTCAQAVQFYLDQIKGQQQNRPRISIHKSFCTN